jgi:hypothetical protein
VAGESSATAPVEKSSAGHPVVGVRPRLEVTDELREKDPQSMPIKRPLTTALTDFADALEKVGINPEVAEVSLPLDDWRHLARVLDQERGDEPEVSNNIGRVRIGGVRYLIRHAAEGRA